MNVHDEFRDSFGYGWKILSVKPNGDPDICEVTDAKGSSGVGSKHAFQMKWGIDPGSVTSTSQPFAFGGILNWLPPMPVSVPVQPAIVFFQDYPTPKKVKTVQEVSHNGKDWCRYELLLDSDPFEDFKFRREV